MSADTSKTGKQDRDRIPVNKDYELRDWRQIALHQPDELKSASQKVGQR